MRDNKIIHKEEAYLGAMEATISYSIVGKGRESVVYDDLDKLDTQWKPYGNGLVKSQNGRTAKIEIKVFYQDGRGQRAEGRPGKRKGKAKADPAQAGKTPGKASGRSGGGRGLQADDGTA